MTWESGAGESDPRRALAVLPVPCTTGVACTTFGFAADNVPNRPAAVQLAAV